MWWLPEIYEVQFCEDVETQTQEADLFWRSLQLQYKPHLMKSYVEYSGIFLKADTKTMHDGGKDFIRTLKTHLELHHKLKYNLLPEELHP